MTRRGQVWARLKKILSVLVVLTLLGAVTVVVARSGAAPTADELVRQFPDIGPGSSQPENRKILCPFVRMMHRAGLIDDPRTSVWQVTKAAQELGCGMWECGAVAAMVSDRQRDTLEIGFGEIDLERLHQAEGIAHDCGFTFAKGGTEVDPEVRQRTMERLGARSDTAGRLRYQDVLDTRLAICEEQGVEISGPGLIEVQLIYAYLGGLDRGYIDLADVERLFRGEMPGYKAKAWLHFELEREMAAAIASGDDG